MKPTRHPRITPLRAQALLREIDESIRHYRSALSFGLPAIDAVREALASHVRAALVKRVRERAKRSRA